MSTGITSDQLILSYGKLIKIATINFGKSPILQQIIEIKQSKCYSIVRNLLVLPEKEEPYG